MSRFLFGVKSIAKTKPILGFAGRLAMEPAKPRAGFISPKSKNMQGKVKTIVQFKPTTRVIKILVNGMEGKTYIDEANGNSKKWSKVKVGDCLLGLKWFDEERKIIDADSDVEII